MKLSISNIIWKKGKENFENFLKIIVQNNIYAVELSLNSIFEEPLNMSSEELLWLKNLLKKYNVSVSALHSLTYTRPDLEIFNTKEKREELLSYLLYYVDIARELNTYNIVYGSPKSRKKYNYSNNELDTIFVDFLYQIDKNLIDINFNIEPLPKLYCEYLNTFMDGVNILKKNDFKNIFIQLDVRSIIESKEDIDELFLYNKYIKHVHIGEPNLTMPSYKFEQVHKKIDYNLFNINYKNYCSIEVVNHKEIDTIQYIIKTIKNTRRYYGN